MGDSIFLSMDYFMLRSIKGFFGACKGDRIPEGVVPFETRFRFAFGGCFGEKETVDILSLRRVYCAHKVLFFSPSKKQNKNLWQNEVYLGLMVYFIDFLLEFSLRT